MRRTAVCCLFLLVGCASQELEKPTGDPIEMAMARNGAPANAFDLPDGRRAFQWVRETTAHASAMPGGDSAWWRANAPIEGGRSIAGGCVYTLYARWNDDRRMWLVEEMAPLPAACEDPSN